MRVRLLIVLSVVLGGAGVASAQNLSLQGWNAEGDFVFYVADPFNTLEWAGGAGEFMAACKPGELAPLGADMAAACHVCVGADGACTIATPATKKHRKGAKASPNKKAKLEVQKKKCVKGDAPVCNWTVKVGKLGTTGIALQPGDKPTFRAVFRPDSGAVWLSWQLQSASDEAITSSAYLIVALPLARK